MRELFAWTWLLITIDHYILQMFSHTRRNLVAHLLQDHHIVTLIIGRSRIHAYGLQITQPWCTGPELFSLRLGEVDSVTQLHLSCQTKAEHSVVVPSTQNSL